MKKWSEWYKLPKDDLKILSAIPELRFLRHNGYWRITMRDGAECAELKTNCIYYDTTMGVIFALLNQNYRIAVKPYSRHNLIIEFCFPNDDPDFRMWTQEEIRKRC